VTGFIGAHVADVLLSKGYKVRGTSRSASKAQELIHIFNRKHPGGCFDVSIIPDMERADAFHHVLEGVHGIIHTASPVIFFTQEPFKDVIEPARRGTVNILEAALGHGHDIQRVVITSSIVAVAEPKLEPYEYTESDWNAVASAQVEKDGKNVAPTIAYCASKYEAETAAWNFMDQKKPKFDLCTILPTMVYGPHVTHIERADQLNPMNLFLYSIVAGAKELMPDVPAQSFVDVRDVALAHVRALESPEAAGRRFLVTSEMFKWPEVVDILNKAYPGRYDELAQKRADQQLEHRVSNAAAKEKLGMIFTGLERCILDAAVDMVRLYDNIPKEIV